MKKIVSLALSAIMATGLVAGLSACGGNDEVDYTLKPVAKSEVKVGYILLHDENSTYDLNFLNAANRAKENMGLLDSQVIIKKNIEEGQGCYEAAADLVDQGCDVIFADSFGHEDFIIQAAAEFPQVRFCHATGTKAHTTNLPNIHNAFASIYEGRYLAGVAAGMKLLAMGETKMGYVGAFPYAEVVSGYTSFYLGAKSVCEDVTMDVTFTNSWYDPTAEANGAELLITAGAKLISQHADSMGAPSVCETRGVPNVSYNGSTETACPNTFIVSSYIDWTPYFEYMVNCVIDGVKIATDWCGTIATGSVKLTEFGAKAPAAGTVEAVNLAKAGLLSGTLKVFDTSKFTVGGQTISSYLADVHNRNFAHDTEAIVDGVFAESSLRSAPYFDAKIDGITILDTQQAE